MMSLKSGLLTETAWALDKLTILFGDDATVGFVRLGHLPGVLDTVVEHFWRNLINVFDVLRESEIHTGIPELEANVDCIMSSPDKSRLTKAYKYLVKLFSDKTMDGH